MHIDYSMIINDLGLIIGFIAAVFGLNKKFPFLTVAAHFLEDNAVTIGQTVEKVAEEVIKTPIGAAIESKFKHEIDTISNSLQQSEIAKYALIGLHSFGSLVANLSPTQKIALFDFIKKSVPEATDEQINKVIEEAEKAVNEFANLDLVKAANLFTQVQTAAIAPVDGGQGQAQ